MNSYLMSDAELREEHLARLALDLNLNLGAGDYSVLSRVGQLGEADMLAVLAASNEMAMLMLKLAVNLAAGMRYGPVCK